MAVALSILLLILAVLAAGVLVVAALRLPAPTPAPLAPPIPSSATERRHRDGRVRLTSRLLFARRSLDAITLDCTLESVDGELPPGIDPPEGLPFTLRLRCPDTTWFAGRVEQLLREWADENRELVLELAPDHGKVRTTIASGGSSVHLELAGAAGLGSGLTT